MDLYACIREYFNFASDKQYRGRTRLSLYLCDEEGTSENGHYHINQDGTIDFGLAKSTEYSQYTNESFESITTFFRLSEKLMMDADWNELAKQEVKT